ncbi:MAG: rhomboid family intramembrane serine protease [Christensenellales bacterium]
MNWLNALERKLYRLRIHPFFRYIIFAMAGVYLLQLFFPRFNLIGLLSLHMPSVYRGQIWRLITFLLIPQLSSPLYALLTLYFYYFIGTALENRWGARRFFIFYVIGALGAILAGLLTQFGMNTYIYLSMFFAFAILNPENQVLLFFVLPIKMKWLALLNAAFFLVSLIGGSWPERAAIIASLFNIFLFFGGDIINLVRDAVAQWQRRQSFKRRSR